MKKISLKYLFLALILSFGMTACNDFEDENFDFSNPLPAYVELVSGSAAAVAGGDAVVQARVRVALQSDVNVSYEITGDITQSGTIVIAAGDLTGDATITVPSTPDTGSATLAITGVDNGLSVGRGDAADALSILEAAITWAP